METIKQQSEKLKINATNIKSYLVDSNKKLKKLNISKKNFVKKETERKTRLSEESRIETPFKSFGRSVGNIASNIARSSMSFFDKVKEFFGLVLMGIIINNLPYIIDQVKTFFENNPWIISGTKFVFGAIGKGILGIINLVNFLSPDKQKETEKNLDGVQKELSSVESEEDVILKQIDGELRKNSSNTQENVEGVTPTKLQEPSIEPSPSPNISNQNDGQSSIQPTPTQPVKPIQKYAIGGLVNNSENYKRAPAPAPTTKTQISKKTSVKTSNSFVQFENNVKLQKQLLRTDQVNKKNFADVVEKLRKAQKLVAGSSTPSTTPSDPTQPDQPPASAGAANLSGLNISVDSTGEPGYDITHGGADNIALFDGVVVPDPLGTNHQISGNRGYGNFMIIRSDDPNNPGKQFDALYAHFPNQNFPKPGERITKGQVLGRMGTLNDPVQQRGSITGTHMSVDFFPAGGPYTKNNPYSHWRGLQPLIGSNRSGSKPKKPPGGGSNLTPISLNRNIGEDMGSENSTIALQRVFVIKKQFVPMPLPLV